MSIARIRTRSRFRPLVELLESRLAPSVATALPFVRHFPGPVHAGRPQVGEAPSGGYGPSQIQHAYGFDQITFNGGVHGDGSGQTIAIIDAYDDPNISSDLAAFDAAFGLPAPPSFRKVNQNGGTTYPTADQGWALEISLDVEWAHAMAPAANILLVEANSNNFMDLWAAIDYARNQPGVSVVSMSFGGSEWNGETSYDAHYTTPSGHGGVTFVASSGDSGTVEYPAISPNILGVGGTNLYVDGSNNYSSESGWSGSGGGIGVYYGKPSYQNGVVTQSSSKRTTPDVSYDGSGSTPFGIYDSYGYGGWVNVAGTSAGAPQWAALIAIANQGRALAGQSSLDGPSQTMSKIYALPQSDFHDVTSGSNAAYSAGTGYDLVTGRGSPYANWVASALIDGTTGSAPTLVTAASATPNPVTGATTNMSALGSDGGDGSSLGYSWAVTSAPGGAATPTFSANGTSAAKNTSATFYAAGSYTFTVTIANSSGSVTSSVGVVVAQTLTSLGLTPTNVTLASGASQLFSATALDQFGKALASQPAFVWTLSGIGTLSTSGLYTAPATTGTATVQVAAGGLVRSASVTVNAVPAAPTGLTATATSAKVTLNWLASANASGYTIQRSNNGTNWSTIGTTSALTFADNNVVKKKTYYYRVAATNASGTSQWTTVLTVVVPSTGAATFKVIAAVVGPASVIRRDA